MDIVIKIAGIVYNLGGLVLMPVLLLTIGLCSGLDFARALRSTMLSLAAYFGVLLIVNRICGDFGSFAQMFTDRFGFSSAPLGLNYSVVSSMAASSRLMLLALPIGIAVNLLLVLLRSCRTINIDLWSFWHMAFTGILVQSLTGSFYFALAAVAFYCALALLFADLGSARTEKATGIAGAAVTHGFITAFAPLVWAVNAIIDLIPGLAGKDLTFDYLKKRLGLAGEPALWCAVAGGALGLLCGKDIYAALQFAAIFAVLALLLPTLGELFGNGFGWIAEKMYKRQNEGRRKGRVSVGFSAFVAFFNPTVLFTALALLPLTLWLGALPVFDFVPAGDAAMVLYIAAAAVLYSGGGLIRSLLSGVVSVAAALFCGHYLSGMVTAAAQSIDATRYAEYGLFNSLAGGSSPIVTFEVFFASFGVAGIAFCIVFLATLIVINRNRIAAEHRMVLAENGEVIYPISGDFKHWTHYLKKKPELTAAAKAAQQEPSADAQSAEDETK